LNKPLDAIKVIPSLFTKTVDKSASASVVPLGGQGWVTGCSKNERPVGLCSHDNCHYHDCDFSCRGWYWTWRDDAL